jgi:hypothetical protein
MAEYVPDLQARELAAGAGYLGSAPPGAQTAHRGDEALWLVRDATAPRQSTDFSSQLPDLIRQRGRSPDGARSSNDQVRSWLRRPATTMASPSSSSAAPS